MAHSFHEVKKHIFHVRWRFQHKIVSTFRNKIVPSTCWLVALAKSLNKRQFQHGIARRAFFIRRPSWNVFKPRHVLLYSHGSILLQSSWMWFQLGHVVLIGWEQMRQWWGWVFENLFTIVQIMQGSPEPSFAGNKWSNR